MMHLPQNIIIVFTYYPRVMTYGHAHGQGHALGRAHGYIRYTWLQVRVILALYVSTSCPDEFLCVASAVAFDHPAMATRTDVTAWTVHEVKEWEEEQWPGSEVAEKMAGTVDISA